MQRVEENKANGKICMKFCGKCPSYPVGSGRVLFCATGTAMGKVERKGCNCPNCDVQKDYGCKGLYYCTDGACD